jgi:NAD(P)-dependent dehydrogenase (short-subunit alcohol dehydrogenase family)
MSNNIEGKVIVITGASSGMGAAAARHLFAQGATVVLGAPRVERLHSRPVRGSLSAHGASGRRRGGWSSCRPNQQPRT